MPGPLYRLISTRAGHHCEYCKAPEVLSHFEFDIEHVTPVSLGGTAEPENLALACRACNGRRGSAEFAVDPTTQAIVRLFNPRADQWTVHFRLDERLGRIVGLTSIGRATVRRLGMNRAISVAARRCWIAAGYMWGAGRD